MVVIKATGGPGPAAAASHLSSAGSSATGDPGTTPLSSQVVQALSVPSATLDAVGSPSSVSLPDHVTGGSVLRAADGKPVITYVGAEYCPFCAAERWALAVALTGSGRSPTCRAPTHRVRTCTRTRRPCPSTVRPIRARTSPSSPSRRRRTNRSMAPIRPCRRRRRRKASCWRPTTPRGTSRSSTSAIRMWSRGPASRRRSWPVCHGPRSQASCMTRRRRSPRRSMARPTTSRRRSAP